MNSHPTSLDLSRLEFVRRSGSKLIAQCPACAAEGRDNSGDHLAIYDSGAYCCIVHHNDKAHNRKIRDLAGIHSTKRRNGTQERQWRQNLAQTQRDESIRQRAVETARSNRGEIISRHPWSVLEMLKDSPQKLRCHGSSLVYDPSHFLSSLFSPDAIIWTGEVYQSGCSRYARHWRTCHEWCSSPTRYGPMVSPAIWKPGTVSRAESEVASSPYVVLDFDGFDGVAPPKLGPHLAASLAIVRWLREVEDWNLAAILWTGNKSLHAWFHSPPQDAVKILHPIAKTLGIDQGLIGHPEHPSRLPGQSHIKSGRMSQVLWLQNTQPQA